MYLNLCIKNKKIIWLNFIKKFLDSTNLYENDEKYINKKKFNLKILFKSYCWILNSGKGIEGISKIYRK